VHPARCVAGAGQGCGPGALGVCIGGDRASGYHIASSSSSVRSTTSTPTRAWPSWSRKLCRKQQAGRRNEWEFGGKATLIGCKIAAANRLPASFFVSVAYDCWAFRRLGVLVDPASGAIKQWLYRDPSRPVER